MLYAGYFAISFILSLITTKMALVGAIKLGFFDVPSEPRKLHTKPVPFLGGAAVFAAFILGIFIYLKFGQVNFNIVPFKFFSGLIFGGAILVLGGIIDDKYTLPPKVSWLFPALAAVIVVFSGIGVGIKFLTNPFGGQINISYLIFGIPLSGLLTWIWIMGMTYTTKLLDGLDGLCGGIAFIGGLTIFLISLGPKVNQPITATIAIIFSGVLLGYLFYAFNPAKIFLGEGGSTFLGFTLGVLSVILGAKIATALLVMGIPILDVAWVIIRRLWYRRSPFSGDRQHLHFRLLDIGLSQRQAVLALYGISAIFGGTAVFLQSKGKLVALFILFCLMMFLAITTVILYKRKHPHVKN